MKNQIDLMHHVSSQPLFGLALTLLAYKTATAIQLRCKSSPFANPVAISVAIVLIAIHIFDITYASYFDGARFIHMLLGPATVAMALPLYQHGRKLSENWFAFAVATVMGSLTAVATTLAVAKILATPSDIALSLSPKSVTAPIAMGIAEKIGGIPSLTAAIVISTGIFGAIFAGKVFDLIGVKKPHIRGFSMGISAHGIGTARAFQVSPETGAYSALAMGVNGLLTATFLPMLLQFSGFL